MCCLFLLSAYTVCVYINAFFHNHYKYIPLEFMVFLMLSQYYTQWLIVHVFHSHFHLKSGCASGTWIEQVRVHQNYVLNQLICLDC